MDEFEGLIEYLRLHRRSDEAAARGPEITTEVLLSNLEDTETYEVTRENFENDFDTYKRLATIFEDNDPEYIYLLENSGQSSYYILNNQNHYLNLKTNQAESPNEDELHRFPVMFEYKNYIFDTANDKVVTIGDYLDVIPLFFDNLPYDPRGQYLDGLKSKQYDYDFENHRSTFANIVEFFGERFTDECKVDVIKNSFKGNIYLIPTMDIIFTYPLQYTLKYPYVQNGYTPTLLLPDEDCALSLKFHDVSGLIMFLNQTLFNEGFDLERTQQSRRDDLRDMFRKKVLGRLQYNASTITGPRQFQEILKVLYYLPVNIAKEINQNVMWSLFEFGFKGEGLSNNLNVAAEDVFVKLIDILALQGQGQKLLDYLNEDVEETKNKKNDEAVKVTKLEYLDSKIQGNNSSRLAYSISKAWLSTTYTNPFSKQSQPLYESSDGVRLLPYQSEKWLGLYFDNAEISWGTKGKERLVKVEIKTGRYENPLASYAEDSKDEIFDTFWYHPYHPLYIKNVDKQDTAIQLDAVVPAYMLLANDRKQFWHDVVTGGEYVLDVLAIASGVGTLVEISSGIIKTLTVLRSIGALAELSGGMTSALLKLTGAADSEFGQALLEYLFWVEMASLAGLVTASISKGLRNSARKLVANQEDLAKLRKQLDDVVIQEENGVSRKLTQQEKDEIVSGIERNTELKRQNIANGGRSSQFSIVKPKVLKYWTSYLEKKGVRIEIGTNKAIELLREENALGLHVRELINSSTNEVKQTIYLYDNPSTSTFLEECYHAVQALDGLPRYMEPITIRGKTYYNVDSWEYLAKKRILDEATKNGITYEEYLFVEEQLQDVLEGLY